MSEQGKAKEIPLDGVLAEFREALNAEIEAATASAARSAVPLINGKRIGMVGTFTHYAFTVESALVLPSDAEGDLHIQGRASVPAWVISIEGLAVTVSVAEDLGQFVPFARLQSDMVYLLRRLIGRIEEYGEKNRPNPAGERLLGVGEVHGEAVGLESVLPPELLHRLRVRLNQDQLDALGSALGRDTTFIWGPPGTGKTSTIGAIGESLYATDRSLLLVSHTNTAVDQALLRIGDAIGDDELARGAVFRIGQPRDQRLAETKDLLLSTHVRRRSEEMVARRDELETSRTERNGELKTTERLIDLCEWVPQAEQEIAQREQELRTLNAIRVEAVEAERRWRELDESAKRDQELRKSATEAVALAEHFDTLRRRQVQTQTKLQHLFETEMETVRKLREEQDRLTEARRLEPLNKRRQELPSYPRQDAEVARAERDMRATNSVRDEASHRLVEEEQILETTRASGAIRRRMRKLPAPELQEQTVSAAREHLTLVDQATEEKVNALVEARSQMEEIEELDRSLERWSQLGPLSDREQAIGACERDLVELEDQRRAVSAEAEELGVELGRSEVLRAFRDEYSEEPAVVLERLEGGVAAAVDAETTWKQFSDDEKSRKGELIAWTEEIRALIEGCGLTIASQGESVADMIGLIRSTHAEAAVLAAQHNPMELRAQVIAIEDEIKRISAEIDELNAALEEVERVLISEAKVIGATLTKAYLDDRLQERRFDTVLLDEASMAPIPALWAAAGSASRSVVIVGDQKQLPPISHASDPEKHPEAPATRWLGRDVFTAAGAMDDAPPWLIPLTTQYRMKPAISALANQLAYEGLLRDGKAVDSDARLGDWYRRDWGHDADLVLVDTENVGAWVTSVPRGGSASRLNFLSATICVDLAQEMLHPKRPRWQPGDHPRIIIVAPYRAHARLVGLLLRELGLEGEVGAGTVHNFQGSEAPVVIFDTVVDEPHWRVNLFIPSLNQEIVRLLNVAITRAQSRLVIVGDFPYIHKHAKHAVLNDLIQAAEERAPKVAALDVLQVGLSARAARAQALTEGSLKEDRDGDRMIMTQEAFSGKLVQDLAAAKGRVIIYSPFMSQNRVGHLAPHLKAAIDRGVHVYVVTKTATTEERKGQIDTYRQIEASLTDWGVVVAHKRNMHEKVILIDDEIVWNGSLNALSFSDTQEVMERRRSPKIAADYIKTLRVNELLEPFDAGEARCPVCNEELVASEGKDEPFFWRCITPDCHTRSIGDPVPKDGRIVCRSCSGAVEFVDMPSGPHWRCIANKRHRQKVVRNHLKLPKMRALVGSRKLKQLDRNFWVGRLEEKRRIERAIPGVDAVADQHRVTPSALDR